MLKPLVVVLAVVVVVVVEVVVVVVVVVVVSKVGVGVTRVGPLHCHLSATPLTFALLLPPLAQAQAHQQVSCSGMSLFGTHKMHTPFYLF